MPVDMDAYGKQFLEDYNHQDFEVVLTKYRKKCIVNLLKNYNTDRMLEVGCGMEPFFLSYDNYRDMVVVEPANIMFNSAVNYSKDKNNVEVIQGFMEDKAAELSARTFDFILCVELLHEVEDPYKLIKSIHEVCRPETRVLFSTNNPKSFHILLGLEMGVIPNIGIVSERAKTFQRKGIYTKEHVEEMLTSEGFEIIDFYPFFVKPFTHNQMKAMQDNNILTDSMLDGLYQMTKYLPEFCAENIWVVKTKE